MRRKRMLSRKMWYLKRRNMPAIRGLLRVIPVIAALVLLLTVTGARVTPVLEKEAVRQAENRMEQVIGDTVSDALASAQWEQDLQDTGTSGAVDYENAFSSYLSGMLSEKLREPQNLVIGTPLGTISGFGFLYGKGPEIKASLVCMGSAEASCIQEARKNEDISSGSRIIIRVRAEISYQSLFVNGTTELTLSIPAEEVAGDAQALAFSFSP